MSFAALVTDLIHPHCRVKQMKVKVPHMVSRGAPAPSCAPTITILAGAPLCRGGVGVLALGCDGSDGVEHL